MSWRNRLQTCTYKSPSGAEFTLQYEDVQFTGTKKTTAFEFVGSNDVFVQDNRSGIKTYPMNVFFSGDDYDLEANQFFAGLSEQGAGKLQHPIYGLLQVNPVGEIKRSDKLKTGSNEAAFEIKFVETIINLYPSSQTNQKEEAETASSNFDNDRSEEFSELIDIDTSTESQALIEENKSLLGQFRSGLADLTEGQADLQKQLTDTFNSINDSMEELVGDPLTLAFQTIQMVKTVTNSVALIEDKINSYGNLLNDIISPDNTVTQTYNSEGSNSVQTQDLYASANVSAMVDSIVQTDFDTREQALQVATELNEYFDNYMTWKERNYASVGTLDTGLGYDNLQNQVAIASSLIIDLSFSLKRQKAVILDRDTFLIDYAYKYFGTTDNAAIEEVIKLNDLNNSEIWTIPKNRLMRYYV